MTLAEQLITKDRITLSDNAYIEKTYLTQNIISLALVVADTYVPLERDYTAPLEYQSADSFITLALAELDKIEPHDTLVSTLIINLVELLMIYEQPTASYLRDTLISLGITDSIMLEHCGNTIDEFIETTMEVLEDEI